MLISSLLHVYLFLHGKEMKEFEKWKYLFAKEIWYVQTQLLFLYPKLHLCCLKDNFGREILPLTCCPKIPSISTATLQTLTQYKSMILLCAQRLRKIAPVI